MALGVITEFVYSILHSPKTCNIEYGQWLAMLLVKSKMGRGWHWGWCGSWCFKEKRIFNSTWSDIMEYRMWAVVGIAVGKIGNEELLALGLVWLLVSQQSSYIRFCIVLKRVILNMDSGWHCRW